MVQKQVDSPKCFLEIDDPRLAQETNCYMDYFFHAQTLTIIVTHPKGNVVETIRFPVYLPTDLSDIQEPLENWHRFQYYLVSTPCEGDGKKQPLRGAEPLFKGGKDITEARPQIDPPWVTNPHKFGAWRPSLLSYEDYHLIEVVIDGEKSFVCWRNLSQSAVASVEGTPHQGFELRRRDGSYLRIAPFPVKEVGESHGEPPFTSTVYCRINPPGVAPEGLCYSRPHDIDEHVTRGKFNTLESEYSVNRRIFAVRDLRGDIFVPLDDDGYPLVQGFINGLEVYVDRESYWQECYLSVSILNGMTIGLYRTNGTHEVVQFTVTNEHVLKALGKMVSAWRELWPDQVPGFVRDLSADWVAHERKNAQEHWFNPSFGFEDKRILNERVDRKLPGGGTETEADISVREVSHGFGLRLMFGDGSQKVIHFHTADHMLGRREIGDLITVWNTLQGDTVGIFQSWPVVRESGWNFISALSKLFTGEH